MVACYVNANGHVVVMWEYADRALQVFAVHTDGLSKPVYDWWLSAARTPLR